MPIISSSAPDRNLSDLVEKIRSFGSGLGIKDDRVGYLTSAITADATSILVDDASQFSAGWIEIDLELIRVKSVNPQSNLITVGGRGYRATTPTEHVAGSEILFTPTMARSTVVREINREIAGSYPTMPGVDTSTFVASPSIRAYEIPDDAAAVLDVRRKDDTGNWYRVTGWETEFSVDTTDFPSGQALTLRERVPSGSTVQIVYAKRPQLLNGLGDPFSATGLPDSMADVVEMGALVRLLPAFDIARLSNLTVAENDIGAQRQVGGGSIIARELKAQYQVRLEAEQLAFAKKYPPRFHHVG